MKILEQIYQKIKVTILSFLQFVTKRNELLWKVELELRH